MCVVSEMILDFRRISEERRCEFENFNGFLRDLRYGFGIVGQAEIVVGQVRSVVGRVEIVVGRVESVVGRVESVGGQVRRVGERRRAWEVGRGAFAARRRWQRRSQAFTARATPLGGVRRGVRQACGRRAAGR